ncbi:MAG: NADH-quinone oxidoreductase subunit J [Lautropia sp.]|nr:NADH-quinone oxidoreductase subunit J [Lautropia sp.]MDO5102245.1 NADH-quinone oxidoreductase subunit J [Lautropia sp.]
MDVMTSLFFLFAFTTVFAASRVITARNPVHSALFLVLTFVSTAAVWLLMKAEFLAIVLVLVYVGAVMVLFLFVVMMLDVNAEKLRAGFWRSLPVALFVGCIIVIELSLVLWVHFSDDLAANVMPLSADHDNAKALGELLYTDYIYPLEIAGMILLVGMVAAIALTIRRRKDVKSQRPGEQVRVRAADRVRLVSVPAARREAEAADAAEEPAAQADEAAPAQEKS